MNISDIFYVNHSDIDYSFYMRVILGSLSLFPRYGNDKIKLLNVAMSWQMWNNLHHAFGLSCGIVLIKLMANILLYMATLTHNWSMSLTVQPFLYLLLNVAQIKPVKTNLKIRVIRKKRDYQMKLILTKYI